MGVLLEGGKTVMKTRFRRQVISLAAIFLLFSTQYIYFHLELGFSVDDLCFAAAELVFFYVLYAFSLLELFIPEAVWTVLGCAALVVLRGRLLGFYFTNDTVFLAHLPVCIFLLALDFSQKRAKHPYGILLTGVYPTLFLGYLLYYAARFPETAERIIKTGLNYGCFAFPALIVLYGAVRRTRGLKKEKNTRELDFIKDCFLFAILAMAETFFMLRVWATPALNFTVSLFWLMDLLILFRKENPLAVSFFRRLPFGQETVK